MKVISATQVRSAVRELYLQASFTLPDNIVDALQNAVISETSQLGKEALAVALKNCRVAAQDTLPLCQDTGLACVFVEWGQEVLITEGDFMQAVLGGIEDATAEGYLRASVLDPLTGINTNTNTPVPVHIESVPGEVFRIDVAPKGGGSENKGRVAMLTPAEGLAGALEYVVETVKLAGGAPCPPLIVGVGIGGNMESCALLAKKALLRNHNKEQNNSAVLANFENACLQRINALGIGPQGLGGKTTALAVHALAAPCHIATFPVAVALQCHVARHFGKNL
ncbi:MAG: fumarate hydratase [Clostridia bacterium]|nr:fumarate hydratase [Clostridia bacterium]